MARRRFEICHGAFTVAAGNAKLGTFQQRQGDLLAGSISNTWSRLAIALMLSPLARFGHIATKQPRRSRCVCVRWLRVAPVQLLLCIARS